jgi:hypothetical protein
MGKRAYCWIWPLTPGTGIDEDDDFEEQDDCDPGELDGLQ